MWKRMRDRDDGVYVCMSMRVGNNVCVCVCVCWKRDNVWACEKVRDKVCGMCEKHEIKERMWKI